MFCFCIFNWFRFHCCPHTASSVWEIWRSSWWVCIPGPGTASAQLPEAGFWFPQQNTQGKPQGKEAWIDSYWSTGSGASSKSIFFCVPLNKTVNTWVSEQWNVSEISSLFKAACCCKCAIALALWGLGCPSFQLIVRVGLRWI